MWTSVNFDDTTTSTMSGERLIVVSNQDSRINYAGDWSLSNSSSFQTLGSFGPPLEDTLHMTTSDSSFAFSFSGTYISVLGLIITDSSASQLKMECLIDGVIITPSITTEENNVHLCATNLSNGSHELVANISTQGSSFFLDNLQYAPSADVPLNNATVIIPNIDSSITYSPEWTELGGFTTNMTEVTNAFANVSFVGNRVGWFGIIPGSEPHAPSPAEYSIDDGPLVSFTLPGLPSGASNSNNIFNIPFFITEVLEQGSHTLFVRYLGNDSTTPLTLNNLLVTNASSSKSSPSLPSSPSPPPSPSLPVSPSLVSSSPSGTTPQRKPIGAIVGGAVGGIAGIGLMVALLFVYRKRSRSGGLQSASNTTITPFMVEASHAPQAHSPATRESGLSNGITTSQRTKSSTTTSMAHAQTRVSSPQQGPSTGSGSSSVPAPAQSSHVSSPLITSHSNYSISDSNPVEEAPLVRVQHEDSGLRIDLDIGNVVELPPNYTVV